MTSSNFSRYSTPPLPLSAYHLQIVWPPSSPVGIPSPDSLTPFSLGRCQNASSNAPTLFVNFYRAPWALILLKNPVSAPADSSFSWRRRRRLQPPSPPVGTASPASWTPSPPVGTASPTSWTPSLSSWRRHLWTAPNSTMWVNRYRRSSPFRDCWLRNDESLPMSDWDFSLQARIFFSALPTGTVGNADRYWTRRTYYRSMSRERHKCDRYCCEWILKRITTQPIRVTRSAVTRPERA